jgi:ribosomal protein L7/L12
MTIIKVSIGDLTLEGVVSRIPADEVRSKAMSLFSTLIKKDISFVPQKWSIRTVSCGDRKIEFIKEIRSIANIGLKESKDASEIAGSVIYETTNKARCDDVVRRLRASGGHVSVTNEPAP